METESVKKFNLLPDLGLALADDGHEPHRLYVTSDFNIGTIVFAKNRISVIAKTIFNEEAHLMTVDFEIGDFMRFWLPFDTHFQENYVLNMISNSRDQGHRLEFGPQGGLHASGRIIFGYIGEREVDENNLEYCSLTSLANRPDLIWHKGKKSFRPLAYIAAEAFALAKAEGLQLHGLWPYLNALMNINVPADSVGTDSAESILSYFLSNSEGWRSKFFAELRSEFKDIKRFIYARK